MNNSQQLGGPRVVQKIIAADGKST